MLSVCTVSVGKKFEGGCRTNVVFVKPELETGSIVFLGLVDSDERSCTWKVIDDPVKLVS